MKNYIVVGLTGQSGAGKTTAGKIFEQNGFSVINCDIIARNVTSEGSDCCKQLALYFPQCFDEKLVLNRRALAEIVFNDSKKLELLNKIIFPFINADINKTVIEFANNGKKYILLDAPTLFEAGADKLCSCIVSCVAQRELRAKRIAIRDNIDMNLIISRFDSQKSEDFFKERSDYIIENNGQVSDIEKQCKDIISSIKGRFDGEE